MVAALVSYSTCVPVHEAFGTGSDLEPVGSSRSHVLPLAACAHAARSAGVSCSVSKCPASHATTPIGTACSISAVSARQPESPLRYISLVGWHQFLVEDFVLPDDFDSIRWRRKSFFRPQQLRNTQSLQWTHARSPCEICLCYRGFLRFYFLMSLYCTNLLGQVPRPRNTMFERRRAKWMTRTLFTSQP